MDDHGQLKLTRRIRKGLVWPLLLEFWEIRKDNGVDDGGIRNRRIDAFGLIEDHPIDGRFPSAYWPGGWCPDRLTRLRGGRCRRGRRGGNLFRRGQLWRCYAIARRPEEAACREEDPEPFHSARLSLYAVMHKRANVRARPR